MIRLCLFDLDQTLIDTSDMKGVREAGVGRKDSEYLDEVRSALGAYERHLISEATLLLLLAKNEALKMGVFTRAPRRYTETILAQAYPQIVWDTIVAFENVRNYKPHREGIYRAMREVGMGSRASLPDVLMVGDSDLDIRAAYHAGCRAALFRKGWPERYEPTHWRCLGLLPDAILRSEEELTEYVASPSTTLPDLECLLEDYAAPPSRARFDEIGKFFPKERTRHVIHAAGRNFTNYAALDCRREWHKLTSSLHDHKHATRFAPAWVQTIETFIRKRAAVWAPYLFGADAELVITSVPARPGREHRLGHLLSQLGQACGDPPRVDRLRLTIDPSVFAYRPSVRSQSGDFLSQDERFANVRDNLYVVNSTSVVGRRYLVIDDVSTSGASLLYAERYLTNAGASSVSLLALSHSISDPLRQQ